MLFERRQNTDGQSSCRGAVFFRHRNAIGNNNQSVISLVGHSIQSRLHRLFPRTTQAHSDVDDAGHTVRLWEVAPELATFGLDILGQKAE